MYNTICNIYIYIYVTYCVFKSDYHYQMFFITKYIVYTSFSEKFK